MIRPGATAKTDHRTRRPIDPSVRPEVENEATPDLERGRPRDGTNPSMRVGKSSGPVQRIWVESSRTSPSPSASVDLAHLRPRPRFRFVHSRHTSSEPEAEGDSPGPRQTLRADADVIVTLNHLFGIIRSLGRRQQSGIQGTPPFNWAKVGDGAAFGLRYGVVQWSSRPPGHRLSSLKPLMIRSLQSSSDPLPPRGSHRRLGFRVRRRLADLQ